MVNRTPNFSPQEYAERLAKTQRAMQKSGIDTLIVTDPSNMNWLSGYDGWSFYVHQCVVVPLDRAPFWFGRKMDAAGALLTVWLPDEDVVAYPEAYVQTPERHPMQVLAARLCERGLGGGTIGLEMDNYYFTAAADATLRQGLPNARFKDATGLVNWQRARKSVQELDYMRTAGQIAGAVHKRILEIAEPGVRKNVIAGEIFHSGIMGVDGKGGDYSAFMPIIAAGADASAPHLTWDENPLQRDEGIFFELGGCYRRYHCPLCRTLYLGKPSDAFLDAEKATLEGMEAGLAFAKAGNTCEDMANAYFAVLKRHGIEKDSRAGYAIGVSYPPDWGERTMSIRPGDRTVLEPGMTFHFMTGVWLETMGFEMTESIAITQTGYELLADVPRRLFVKD
ncbi:ectoine hydrolase DoeA [Bosea sp. (in: a-proteobacteria)]|uniref:ectoine hydrolase DoeA n=1 Tax=Bosea sp. (in: a-proteobacteria) TaxID=1871050 RepID=UPI0026137854|nr:ectoine hydrolase DoeA [Bosea sp. (in: a-proteobacteria)]MCO5089494.1 ectoine hydrolase DoeA [Bosea sp. (in: a-proteobacteria)]